jgi:hypothetical protein
MAVLQKMKRRFRRVGIENGVISSSSNSAAVGHLNSGSTSLLYDPNFYDQDAEIDQLQRALLQDPHPAHSVPASEQMGR